MTDLVPVNRPIVGTQDEVKTILENLQARGWLLTPRAQLRAVPTRRNPDLWWVRAEFLTPRPKMSLRDRAARLDRDHPIAGPVSKALLFGLGVLAGVLGLLFALIELIKHTISPQALTTFGGFLLVVGLLFALAAGKGHGRHSGKGWHYTDCK